MFTFELSATEILDRDYKGSVGQDESIDVYVTSSAFVPTSWHPRTGELAFFDDASDIWILPQEGEPVAFLNSRFNERSARFSPDGRWIAYVSDETGTYQVYLVPFPGPGPKIAVSIEGGLSPIWSQDGRELFFRKGSKLMAASVAYEPTMRIGQPVVLFDGPYNPDFMGHQRYDVSPDGKRFLMVENSGSSSANQFCTITIRKSCLPKDFVQTDACRAERGERVGRESVEVERLKSPTSITCCCPRSGGRRWRLVPTNE